ncbi:hypothetical protein RCL_jg28714.t1 [Rhizophagus clarus]|uniref:Uncharacterized protein n=1 Tax=Rhizophagus clarus TaxID=94130 RepID=A0A8H3LTX3_9GLOM|nr:hypothetical protein RCL_jg28714.t1 [Rhizophagus clarus]
MITKRNINSAQKQRQNNNNNKNNKRKSPMDNNNQRQDKNDIFVTPMSDPSTRLISPIQPTVKVKKELVNEKGHNIINPEIIIISNVDRQIVNNTYGDNNDKFIFVQKIALNVANPLDLKVCDLKKLKNTIFNNIKIQFDEPYTNESTSKLGNNTSVDDQEIKRINILPVGQYQHAYITFVNKNPIDHFHHKWSHMIGTYSVKQKNKEIKSNTHSYAQVTKNQPLNKNRITEDDTTNKNKKNNVFQYTKPNNTSKVYSENNIEDELSSKHQKYLKNLMNAALNDIKGERNQYELVELEGKGETDYEGDDNDIIK